MLSNNIKNWLKIIDGMQNENTYKLAWGRAIIESLVMNNGFYINDYHDVGIKFSTISTNMIKYYWNQMFFFNLKQSPKRIPKICQYTKELIDEYIKITNSKIPVWSNEGLNKVKEENSELYNKIILLSSKALHENVSWRFKRVADEEISIYKIDESKNKNDSLVIFSENNALELIEYSIILSKLLNYKWTQLLEKFNFAPKISLKVNSMSDAKVRRNNLTKYKEQLLKEFEDGKVIDFYTGKELNIDDISIDHVLPWSFMYSDDIWNLVITSKSYNSSKSNSIPSEEVIKRLKERNNKLYVKLNDKYKDDMFYAIQNNLIDKYYFDSRV